VSEAQRHRPSSEAELVELLRSSDAQAPASLHRTVEAMIAQHGAGERAGEPPRRALPRARGLAALGGLAGAGALVALVIALSGGGSHGLTVQDAAALTLRPALQGAPAERSPASGELTASVQGVAFPYWAEGLGWRATGERTDTVAGRTVTTVFYADSRGRRVGYAIVAGTPAPQTSGGSVWWRDGTAFRVQREHGAMAVSWLRAGHLCVVSSREVPAQTLVRLASWQARRA
jgi:hypothetical protein